MLRGILSSPLHRFISSTQQSQITSAIKHHYYNCIKYRVKFRSKMFWLVTYNHPAYPYKNRVTTTTINRNPNSPLKRRRSIKVHIKHQ